MKYLRASIKSSSKIQKLFIFFFIAGLVFNIILGAMAYYHLVRSSAEGIMVSNSYRTLGELRSLNEILDSDLLGDHLGAQSISSRIAKLKVLVKDPQSRILLDQLTLQIGKRESIKTLSVIFKMETELLESQMESELLDDIKYERIFAAVLIFDGILLSLLFFFFVMALRERKIAEINFNGSLNNIREANLNLEAEIVRRQNAFKMTVHDLKNPLGTIEGFASLISEDHANSSIHEYSEIIKRVSHASLKLVESILTSSESPSIKMEKIDILPILNNVILQNTVLAENKNQKIILESEIDSAIILGNHIKIEELFANLISNAIKYSPLNGTIWVRCYVAKADYCIEVEDQGAGFSEEDKKLAFRFGEKLSACPTGNETSSGIGLYVAKKIAEIHNARISILTGRNGIGARMHIDMPATKKL